MKINELFEAVAIPARNPKLGYRKDSKIPIGGSKEWLKTFGATEQHVELALKKVRQLPEYRRLRDLGLRDASSERHGKNGSVMFIGTIPEASSVNPSRVRERRYKFTVQPNGKIDETSRDNVHRAPVRSGKPHIVPGDPVSSIVKSMAPSLAKVADTFERRMQQAGKEMAKARKAASAEQAAAGVNANIAARRARMGQ